jgi:hypothetical protein
MQRLAAPDIRRSIVNCSRSEAASLALPKGFDELDWEKLDFLGWRDPKAPLRGYIVRGASDQPGAEVQGIMLRAAESRMSRRVSAMCLLCRSAQSADNVSLFTARRVGRAGRDGNTVGTYICADLACSGYLRNGVPGQPMQPDRARPLAERVDGLQTRLTGFIADVLRTEG